MMPEWLVSHPSWGESVSMPLLDCITSIIIDYIELYDDGSMQGEGERESMTRPLKWHHNFIELSIIAVWMQNKIYILFYLLLSWSWILWNLVVEITQVYAKPGLSFQHFMKQWPIKRHSYSFRWSSSFNGIETDLPLKVIINKKNK